MTQAECDLNIELDQPTRRYSPGEPVRGRVRVQVSEAVPCDGLALTMQRQVGQGIGKQTEDTEVLQLFVGEWTAGSYCYPFELTCPEGPFTHRGALLKLAWLLHARADIPWALDPKANPVEIVVAPPPGSGVEIVYDPPTRSKWQGPFILVIFSLVEAMIAVMLFLTWGQATSGFEELLVAAMLLGIPVIMWEMIRGARARRALGPVRLTIDQPSPATLLATIDIDSARTIERLCAQLLVEETLQGESETRLERHAQALVETPKRSGKHELQFAFEVPKPETVGWSTSLLGLELRWSILCTVTCTEGEDVSERFDLQARPRAPQGDPFRTAR